MKKDCYKLYTDILKEELIPAMGCTEPIAIAYVASIAKDVLGTLPTSVLVEASGSIIKNTKSVFVPNTDHLKGIKAAVAAGLIAGDSKSELEVLANFDKSRSKEISAYLNEHDIEVKYLASRSVFDLIVTVYEGDSYVKVRICDYHTNVVLIEKDHEVIYENNKKAKKISDNRKYLNMEDIYDYALNVDLADVRDVLKRQLDYNVAIAKEGLKGDYGANIGKVLLKTYGDDVTTKAKALTAAGSDARMNGCEMPVIVNSLSGNQGITCSVPLYVYAKEYGVDEERLLRALIVSDLIAIHEKSLIGTLSAYCGAVSAAAGAGAGIAFLLGGGYDEIIHTVSNTLGIVSGIVCDGAKASCAAKIASSIDAAILGYNMYKNGQEFKGGDGIITCNIESTIKNIGKLGKEGMRSTNKEIIKMMTENGEA